MRAGGTWGDLVRGRMEPRCRVGVRTGDGDGGYLRAGQAELANGVACCWFVSPGLSADLPR